MLIIQRGIIYKTSYNLDFQQERMELVDDKLRHIKNFKSLSEQKLIWVGQCQTKSD